MAKAPYKTKQMTEILTFLKSVQGRHVTVNEICDFFREKGISVGTTTIYRHLEKMVKEGLAAKYVIDGSSSACFEYLGAEEHCHKTSCFHCKCEKCGKLIHIQCDEIECLSRHMTEHHDFQLDPKRTVFYGICNECRKNT